jgi:hypothetical protein
MVYELEVRTLDKLARTIRYQPIMTTLNIPFLLLLLMMLHNALFSYPSFLLLLLLPPLLRISHACSSRIKFERMRFLLWHAQVVTSISSMCGKQQHFGTILKERAEGTAL